MKKNYCKIHLKKVVGPTASGTALILGNDEKTFVMFVGLYEGAAILRELNNEKPSRPLTHELISNMMTGFDIQLKQVIISELVDTTFMATLVLEQLVEEKEEWGGKRQEVHMDARPSDCIILALKHNIDIYVTKKVLEKVTDIKTELLEENNDFLNFNWKEFPFPFEKGSDFLNDEENQDGLDGLDGFI